MPSALSSRRVADVFTMFVVTALSLLLLVYVGFAEGKRVYEQFHLEKLTAQGRIVQNAIENFLRVGLPLNQYAGFTTLAEPIVQIREIDAIVVYDNLGRELFSVLDKTRPALPSPTHMIMQLRDQPATTSTDVAHYQIALPLRSRFENVGSIIVYAGKDIIVQRLNASFRVLIYGAFALSAAFALFLLIGSSQMWRSRLPWLQIGYALTFLSMAGVVVATLINLYADGVQGKVKSSAVILAQRLSEIVEFKLRFRDIDGLEKTFGEYRRLNPDISLASLIIDGKVQISTDPNRTGKPWTGDPNSYEYRVSLSDANVGDHVLAVAAPTAIVYQQVERSVRNFAVLFVASGFLAGLFLQMATSLQRLKSSDRSHQKEFSRALNNETALIVVKPVFFLAIFIEHLTYSFLPSFMQQATMQSGLSSGWATAPFAAYYLLFAVTLIPAGYVADRRGPKCLIWLGAVLASLSLFGLVASMNLPALTMLRAAAGVGQAMLFIGVQSYILAVSPPEKKTQAAGIIVFGFQGGMIAGMAIGSLLVVYLQPIGVFLLGGTIGVVAAIYAIIQVPDEGGPREVGAGLGGAIGKVAGDLSRVLRDAEFMRTMFCIGVPAKAVLTGAITFAIPLLLGHEGYRHEEIGQILMLYGIGVVVASFYGSRLVDRTGNTELVLFWGAAASGIGLVLVGVGGSSSLVGAPYSTSVVVLGVIVVGIAHGFINAPVVTHVAQSELAARIGAIAATTAYRFLERIGHIAGPLLVGQVFLIWGEGANILAWIGFITTALGFLFLISSAGPKRSELQSGVAQ